MDASAWMHDKDVQMFGPKAAGLKDAKYDLEL